MPHTYIYTQRRGTLGQIERLRGVGRTPERQDTRVRQAVRCAYASALPTRARVVQRRARSYTLPLRGRAGGRSCDLELVGTRYCLGLARCRERGMRGSRWRHQRRRRRRRRPQQLGHVVGAGRQALPMSLLELDRVVRRAVAGAPSWRRSILRVARPDVPHPDLARTLALASGWQGLPVGPAPDAREHRHREH